MLDLSKQVLVEAVLMIDIRRGLYVCMYLSTEYVVGLIIPSPSNVSHPSQKNHVDLAVRIRNVVVLYCTTLLLIAGS